ncbi:MAG: TIGR00266 family protein, partial [Syntrophomonadaceae bacterium]|nr:TIGR00266 family protein [Syntrophomonadaceae bacterium]
LQSLPFSRLADRIYSASRIGKKKDEGSLLGNIGIGTFLGDD